MSFPTNGVAVRGLHIGKSEPALRTSKTGYKITDLRLVLPSEFGGFQAAEAETLGLAWKAESESSTVR